MNLSSAARSIACIAALAPLTACFQLEGELPRACLHQPSLAISGVPAVVGEVPKGTNIEQSFENQDLTALQDFLAGGLDAEMNFLEVGLSPTSGPIDLSFVESISILGNSGAADSALPDVDVAACEGTACPTASKSFLPANDQVNILDYVKSGSLRFLVSVGGKLPTDDWTLDVDVCVRGSIRYGH